MLFDQHHVEQKGPFYHQCCSRNLLIEVHLNQESQPSSLCKGSGNFKFPDYGISSNTNMVVWYIIENFVNEKKFLKFIAEASA
jgi:hypothetical protein